MIKFRLYYDKDKEEEFLNNMSQKGYELKNFSFGFYTFNKCKANEYTYRIDLVGDKCREELEDYLELLKDDGVILIKRWGPWMILEKKGNFDLYTDKESKIKLYTQIRNMFAYSSIFEGIGVIGNIIPYMTISKGNYNHIFFSVLLSVIMVVFLKQVFMCNRKIEQLKKE